MTQSSPQLDLPFIQPAQAQKHVTHNEAIRALDTLVQLSVTAFDAVTPPAIPTQGETYGIGLGATGDWAGQVGKIATWFDNAWDFLTPRAGWVATRAGEPLLYVHDGADWRPSTTDFDNLPGLGVNTTSDGTNRLAVASAATLLTHAGAGHQLKINKAGESDTASLLFQSNWSGRAEMGLAGTDAFSVKLSADGSSWDEVLTVSAGEGVVTTANMVGTVNAAPGPGNAVIETGDGATGTYTKFADGTLICQTTGLVTTSGTATTWTTPTSFANATYAVTASVTGSPPAVVTLSNPTTGSIEVETFDLNGSNTATPTLALIAIGRWF